MNVSTTISGLLTPFEYESKTVSTAAVGLTASKYQQRGSEAVRDMGDARLAIISCEGRVRYRLDGNADPTSAEGHILSDGDTLTLSSFRQFVLFRAIRHADEGVDAKLKVTYLR